MMLNFKIERTIYIRDRVYDALIECYEIDDCAGGSLNPEMNRDNVFDFDNNLRLVISREKWNGEQVFHVQAIPEGGPVFFESKYPGPTGIICEVMSRLHEIGLMDIIGGDVTIKSRMAGLNKLHLLIKHGTFDKPITEEPESSMTMGTGVLHE